MKDTIFLFFKVTVETSHNSIRDAVKELETESEFTIGSTKNVQVTGAKIITLHKGRNKNRP